MAADAEEQIIERYEETAALYDAFRRTLEDVVRGVVRDLDIQALSVTSRLKEKDSLRDKVRRKAGNYFKLEEVTDIAGIRITTYFADDVDKIADRIPHEFDIDWPNSTDKREVLDPDRFGYLSWHHVVSLSSNRVELAEYSQFNGMKAEIQTRSILQHGWAEIEHDLGYKTGISVPRDYRRRLSRLAGLFELADQEFMSIRDGLAEYEENVLARIRHAPQSVDIDKASLSAYIESSPLVEAVDQRIAAIAGIPVRAGALDENPEREAAVAQLRLLGLTTIQDLTLQLDQHRQEVEWFAGEYLSRGVRGDLFTPGVSVFYLAYVLAGQTQDLKVAEQIVKIIDSFTQGHTEKTVEERATRILRTFESIHNSTTPGNS